MRNTDEEAPALEPDAAQRVSDCWGQTAAARAVSPLRGWLDSALVVRHYVQPKQTGSSDSNWLVGFVDQLQIPRGSHWLSLGCGGGNTEIHAAKQGLFATMEAFDVAPGAIAEAHKAAASAGVANIAFSVGDFSRQRLPRARYDVAMMCMSLHHVLDLDRLLSKIAVALRPGGYFLINEFIGPRQFQFTDLQLDVVRRLLAALPERLRIDVTTGKLKTEYRRMPVEHWNIADPSEAIRSDEIVSSLQRHFAVVRRVDYGGTVLNLLLEHIVHNFDGDHPDDRAFALLLCQIEDLLIRHGVLPSDFTVMALRKRAGLVRRLARRAVQGLTASRGAF